MVSTRINCRDLLSTVIDMMAVLIHGTFDSVEKVEENRKVYQNLIRKLKVGVDRWMPNEYEQLGS